jgi:hypothetical protein
MLLHQISDALVFLQELGLQSDNLLLLEKRAFPRIAVSLKQSGRLVKEHLLPLVNQVGLNLVLVAEVR